MKKVISITDLQRQAGQIVSGFDESAEPIIITQRGRAAAVIISVAHYEKPFPALKRRAKLKSRYAAGESNLKIPDKVTEP